MFDLSGKNALVTGATGGIGEAIATALITSGARIIISGTRAEKLQVLADKLGHDTAILPCDLSDSDAVESLFGKAEEIVGQVDILVNNAGITKDGLAIRMKNEDWQSVIDINLTANFKLSRAAIKAMMKRKYGRIINISSVVGTMGNPGQANYCASKAGLVGMTKSLAAEVASRGITLNCIAPGFIKTAMTDALNEQQQERITANIPASRFGLPDDVAAGVVYLSSDEASYITGQTLHINGGLLMV
jgi:3-oxoacyl-[acyl-carrier protein] reductase